MAKKKTKKRKKRKKAATSMTALVAEELPLVIITRKAAVRPESEWRLCAKCGVCNKDKQAIHLVDCDEGWELPGHPNHLFRNVCINCLPDYTQREGCALLVYDAMRKAFKKKEMSDHEIEQAVHVMWKVFWVDFDDRTLVQMARKLKVKHPWTKGKRTK